MIELKNVKKSYKMKDSKVEILPDINFKLERGEFVAIMGPSGCGKTTLLNILGCMDRMDEGTYIYDHKNINDLSTKELARFRNEEMGFIFQAFHLIDDMTALENIEVPMGYKGVPAKIRKKQAYELLDKVGLKDKDRNKPSQLSGGQQQRIAIARALANNPNILLADEPTGNLDYQVGIEIMDFLKELNSNGLTIIMVTHDNEVASYASKVVKMLDGRIIEGVM